MKRILLVLSLSLAIASGAVVHAQQGGGVGPGISWSRYTVKDEEFSVLLPALPAMTTSQVLRKGDREGQRQRQLETSLDDVLYTIDVYQNPKPKQSLDEFIAEMSADL